MPELLVFGVLLLLVLTVAVLLSGHVDDPEDDDQTLDTLGPDDR